MTAVFDATSRRFRARFAVASALLAAIISFRPFRESDLFWHLALGRAVVREHARVVTEPYALEVFPAKCVAPEWLWDVIVYGAYRSFGYTAIAVVVLIIAAAIGAALPYALGTTNRAALVSAGFLGLALALARIRERPETLATLLLVATMIVARTSTRHRYTLLVAIAVAWAQVHPTFVLAPVVALILLDRRPPALVAAMCAALFTSAHGVHFISNTIAHARGHAVARIADMAAPTAGTFHPITSVFGPLFLVMWVLAIGGALAGRRIDRRHLALATVGTALVVVAVRGLAMGGVLLAPLLADGIAALAKRSATQLLFAAIGALGLARAAQRLDAQNGPWGHVGLLPGNDPIVAARWLAARGTKDRARVYTSFDAGAPIGFLADGRARITLDSRVPLYFSAADLAAADGDPLERATRLSLDFAVVKRSDAHCATFARAWKTVIVEPRFTLFARESDRVVRGVNPCGGEYARCTEDLGIGDDDETFASFLRADHAVRCRNARWNGSVPSRYQAALYPWPRDRLLATMLIADRRIDAAEDLLRPWIEEHPFATTAIIAKEPDRLRAWVTRATPRACWLAKNHPDPRGRTEARSWLTQYGASCP